ncbi:MAG: hypothetical protein WC444_04440 [Candidatus Paceibacterota bacterium]
MAVIEIETEPVSVPVDKYRFVVSIFDTIRRIYEITIPSYLYKNIEEKIKSKHFYMKDYNTMRHNPEVSIKLLRTEQEVDCVNEGKPTHKNVSKYVTRIPAIMKISDELAKRGQNFDEIMDVLVSTFDDESMRDKHSPIPDIVRISISEES